MIENENIDNENLEKALELSEAQKEKLEASDFQKYITDAESLKLIFYFALCGYEIKQKTEIKKILNSEIRELKEYIVKDKEKALCNEACANYLFNNLYPLILQLTTTANLNDKEIYKIYNAKILTLTFSLLDNYYFDNNSFELKINYLSDIITFLCSFNLITKKAREGFTLNKLTETFISYYVQKPESEKSGSILGKIFGGGKK
jgi:hypothetical protein